MPAVSDWAEFLGTGKFKNAKRITGTKDYTDPEVTITTATQLTIEDYTKEVIPGPVWREWGWSLQADHPRVCFLCHELIENGSQAIHVHENLARGLHVRCVPPGSWHEVLGPPRGGDARVMGQLKSKYTREAKKDLLT